MAAVFAWCWALDVGFVGQTPVQRWIIGTDDWRIMTKFFKVGRLLAEFSEGRVIAATEVKTIGWKSSQYCWIVTGWWLWVDKDMRNTKDLLLCQVIPCFLDQLIRHTGTSSCLRDGQARLTKLGQYCVTSTECKFVDGPTGIYLLHMYGAKADQIHLCAPGPEAKNLGRTAVCQKESDCDIKSSL